MGIEEYRRREGRIGEEEGRKEGEEEKERTEKEEENRLEGLED